MVGRGNGSEALELHLVTSAELKRLNGSRPKMGGGAGAGDINGRPPHVWSPPVYRGTLSPPVQLLKRGKPDSLWRGSATAKSLQSPNRKSGEWGSR
jgi:hypothetical protein